jgi:hypothetical protein
MEKIMAQRFAFCDFSQIVGFPNALPDRDQWEDFLPEFHATSWEEPAEHLLDFHEAIHRHNITHEDVRIKLFRCSLKGAALEWCRSLPAASIRSLTGFHTAFNSFCKDYYPADCLYENCCEEFSSLHEASAGPEDQVHDEAFTVEESICQENMEVLNDINCVSPRTEASDIISDASILLDIHNDQHASCGNCEFIEQMWSMVDDSPGYRVEADVPSSSAHDDEDPLFLKEGLVVEEDSSLFPQGVSHDIFLPGIKEKRIMYEQPEAAGPTIPETKFFTGSLFWRRIISMKDNPFLMYIIVMMSSKLILHLITIKILKSQSASRTTPWSLFMMNTNLTRGRAKKRKRNQRNSEHIFHSRASQRAATMRSVSLRQLSTHLCLSKIFNHM